MTSSEWALMERVVTAGAIALFGWIAKKNAEKTTALNKKVDDVLLKFDPLTQTLNGQLTGLQQKFEHLGNQIGRTELLAEQAAQAGMIATALLKQASPILAESILQEVKSPATPVQVIVNPNRTGEPIPVVHQDAPVQVIGNES